MLGAPVVEIIQRAVPDLDLVYVFGSEAAGTAGGASDVDIAFWAGRPMPSVARWHLQEQLAAALGRDVDLVDLASASTVLRVQVVANGELLFEKDATGRAEFEARALGAYARLNEERRAILDEVRSRGSVYG